MRPRPPRRQQTTARRKPLRALFVISYPPTPDPLFEAVVRRFVTPADHSRVLVRAAGATDLIDAVDSDAPYYELSRIDVLGHASPGFLRLGTQTLFDARAGSFALDALAPRLTASTEVRFLGCAIAADASTADGSWAYRPASALRWLSRQLSGARVLAPTRDVFLSDFGPDGLLATSEHKLLASR
ncbi:MAG: hypothetical protein SFW67_26915 [Myxococcaceae bacterium]|nr:hypothetical protein [Myxococcaceae bacterium]